ncbi:MAG: ferric reductase-like transmembrane domain-containing protein [Rhodobacteraceae bacterium]|nr:ferric reductase-like transmembrane domain-containing protein [Paracoccaceae bacterium]
MLQRKGVFAILSVLGLFLILHMAFSPAQFSVRIVATTAVGGVAFLLMTLSIFLSTRISALESWFGGLDRMYQVHKIGGVFAGLLVLAHFFAVQKELPVGADPIVNSLTPSGPLGMIALVISLGLSLNRKIPYSKWRPAHKLMGLVYFLVIGHFMTAPAVFVAQFGVSGMMLILAAIIGVLSYFYSVFGMNKRTALKYEIEAVNPMERATEIVLKPLAGALKHKPGQFAFVEIQGKGWAEPHPFTISSAPGEDNLRFTIKVLGDWTRKVREELTVGGKVDVRGPYGCFDTTGAGDKQIWLAGGVGLTPFLSMIRAMQPDDTRNIHLVYAARDKKDAIFLEELQARAEKLGNVTIVSLFSDEGNFARVDMMKTKLPDALNTYEYFMCGPKPMIEAIMKDLKKEGVSREKIHTEAFEFR